ncbi:MAG: hypothetical protein Q8O55_01785, partial [Dehalococcoidales bacterium]|nr:hypothetical protein [Dehalococcoidales bacterium]
SGLRPFVSSGAAQQVNFPVTMPASPGTYHVYVDVHAGGYLILAYQGTEDIVIAAPAFTFSNVKVVAQWAGGHSYPSPYFTARISNDTPDAITHTLTLHHRRTRAGVPDSFAPVLQTFNLTLVGGGSYNYVYDGWGDHCGKSGSPPRNYCDWPPLYVGYTSYFWLEDEMGNKSVEVSITT